ncbi:MAG: hypothetical protein L3J44_06580, partial [Campylobacteraceae bacterium]|nr:hypothetical protein [Campylobacteraceae bacterium]
EGEEYNLYSFRILVYAKANYDLGNRLDEENIMSGSAISTYDNPSIEFLRISIGLKILVRLTKAGELLGQSLNSALDK